MKAIFSAILVLALSGCASLSQYSSYTISNAQLEQVLDSQLGTLQANSALAGIPVTLDIDDVSVDIGPEGRDVVQLGTLATANIGVMGFNYPAKLSLAFEGTPYYDSDKKAIFVRSLSLLDSSVEASGYKGNLAPLSSEVMALVNRYLETNPVYTLDTNDATVRLLTKVPLDLTIEQGKLALKP